MTNEKLFNHYEKIYFHELARKEQIFSRLSIPLATIIAIAGFYSAIITGDRATLTLGAKIWFLTIIAVSIFVLAVGIYFFIDALLGKIDENLPAPNTIEKYRLDLIEYYSDEEDSEAKVSEKMHTYYYENYMNCATICTLNNDRKSSSLYYCNIFLILAAGIAVIAYAVITIPKL